NTNDPIEKLNQFADSVFKEGRSDPKLRSWLVPPSLDKLRAQVVSLTGLNKIKEQWRYKDFFPSSFEPESDNSSEEQTDEEKMPTELLYDILANRMCPAKEHHAFLQFKFPLHCRRRTPLRLSFNKDKSWDTLNSLDDQSPGEQSSRSLSSFEELKTDVKLETLLQENHLQTTDPEDILRKFRLAFRLASSLHQLYPGPWIHQEWSASLLYIVQAPETRPIEMLYETYVSCVLRKDWRDRISFPEVYPEYCETEICPRFFLSLAQLLVELAKGESDGRFSGELKSEEWYDMLFDELKMRFFRDKLMESYRKAIEGCLFYLQNYNTEAQRTPDEKLRAQSVILQNIVLPLKKNIKVWGSRDHQIQGIGDSFTAGIEYELWSSGDDKHSEKIEEKNPDRSTSENMFTTKMKTFLRSHIEELPESTGGDASGKKVRIAIIDTGFFQDDQDGEDTELLQFVDQGRIKEKRNFFQPIDLSGLEDPDPEPDPDDWEDHHGHGTHVARILLRFAPRAEIVVAKITNTRSLKTTNITQLVKALKWAGEHADIINMSFGLRVTHIQELDDQIARLVGARKLVFAAASNTGGNGSRSWPATQPGVFCIHAMNEFATDVPGMNPTPLEMEHNFAVLGHEIESHWDGKKISISGTSFASPIAAAIAANVLEFTRCMMPETMDLFTTYKSMSGLFRYHMTANSDNSIYHNIMPWINDLWSPGNTAENVCKKLRRVAILGD
ncbi:subtilisin-like protein, partial [Cenococcum geophilum 1.58]